MKRPLLHMILSMVSCYTVLAQSNTELLQTLNHSYRTTQQVLKLDAFNENSINLQGFYPNVQHQKLSNLLIQEKQIEQRALNHQLGLAFKLTGFHNFNNDLNEETNELTRARVRSEVEWQLLKTGWLDNKRKAQQLQDDIAIIQANQQLAQSVLWRRQHRLSYTYAINGELMLLHENKLEVLETFFDVISKLYLDKHVNKDQLIDLGFQIKVTQKEISNYEILNQSIGDSILPEYKNAKLPFLQIIEEQFKPITHRTLIDSLNIAKLEKGSKWYDDIAFSVFANHNMVYTTSRNRNYSGVGFRLKIPIQRRFKKEALQTKIQMYQERQKDRSVGAYNRALTHYNSYREKLKDLRDQQKKWTLKEEEKRRLELLKSDLGDITIGMKLIECQIVQFDILKNMLHIKQQLYTALSHLYELDPKLKLKQVNFGHSVIKDCYVRHSEAYSLKYQIGFLKLKEIQQIKVLASESKLISELENEGFRVVAIEKISGEKPVDLWMQEALKQLKPILE